MIVMLASASLGITYLAQLALLATQAIHLSSAMHQESIHHVKTILLRMEVMYAPAMMDTIS
jgi:outer membrane biosynthesis protein TonB